MSETAADGHSPLIAQPPMTAEGLRTALMRIAPTQVAAFDSGRAEAVATAKRTGEAAPVRRFLRWWALNVAILRHPDVASRLRELEHRAGEVTDRTEAVRIAGAIAAIHTHAAAEAGINDRLASE